MGKRILRMSPELLAELFMAGEHGFEVIDQALPKGAVVVGARMSFDALYLELCISSAAWEDDDPSLRVEEICPVFRHVLPKPSPPNEEIAEANAQNERFRTRHGFRGGG